MLSEQDYIDIPGYKHPQEIVVDQIINEVMTKRFGENWMNLYKEDQPESRFELNRKRFYSEPPQHNI